MEIYRALSEHMPGLVVEAREWRQGRRAGWFRSGGRRLSRLSPGLWRERYALPPGWFHSMNPLSMPLLGRSIARSATRALGARPAVWFFSSPYYLRLLQAVNPEFSVYHPVDDYRWYWPRLTGRTDRFEAAMVARADLVVCVSTYNRNRLQKLCPDNPEKIVHVPNGAPQRFLDAPDRQAVARWKAQLAPLERPLLAYVGDPTGRADLEMLRALAGARIGTLVFAGPNRLPTHLSGHPNVRALGPVLGEEVPGLLQACDVLLIPQEDSELNRAGSPRKLWEYCASGKPIVGSCVTEVESSGDGIRIATTATEFVHHVQDLVARGERPGDPEARRTLALEHSYPVLGLRLLQHLVDHSPGLFSQLPDAYRVSEPTAVAMPRTQRQT